jgi:hypothetical protein
LTDERRLIPLYDASAPIVCTLAAGEVQERRQQLERLRTHLTSVDRTEHGMRLHFPAGRELADELERFAHLEKQCCRFWGFDVHRGREATTLRWDAPPGTDDLVEGLLAWLRGDPGASLSGLL